MKIDLLHTVAQWCGEPLAVAASHVDAFTRLEAHLVSEAARLASELDAKPADVNLMFAGQERPNMPGAFVTEKGVAVIRVAGALSRRAASWHRAYGYMSYEALLETVEEAVTHPSVKAVLLEIDSYGGPAQGLFDTARALRDAAEQSGKPLWAHVNEAALSAGFGLASAASEISIARTGVAGSVGVIAMVPDVSGAADKTGVAYHVFKAGAAKDDTSPFAAMTEEAAARLQADVDDLNDGFCQMVADHRGMGKDDVGAMQAQVYRGEKAVAAGLADQVEPLRDMLARLTVKVSTDQASTGQVSTGSTGGKSDGKDGGQAQAAPVDPQAAADPASETGQAPDQTAEPATELATELAGQTDLEDAIAKETARAEALCQAHAQAQALGVPFDLARAISTKMTVEAANQLVLELKAQSDAAAAINPHQTPAADTPAPQNAAAGWEKAVAEVNRR